jgi:hypothetical protein
VAVSQPDVASSSFQVPQFNRSPVRSLRPTPIPFTVAGLEFEIPALPAADWLNTFMQDWTPDDVLLDLLDNGVDVVFKLEPDEVEDLVMDIIEEATGRYWWVALRLIGAVQGGWHVLGAEMVLQHVDPEKLSLASWLDAMTLVILRVMDKDNVTMFVSQLELPPVKVRAEIMDGMEMSQDQFMSLMRG